MFFPFVSEPNFLPIVNQTEGEHQGQLNGLETISPISNMASASKVWERAKGNGIDIFGFSEQDRNLPTISDCCWETVVISVTVGSREVATYSKSSAFCTGGLTSISFKFASLARVVVNHLGRCKNFSGLLMRLCFSLRHAVRERERQKTRRSLPAGCSKTCSNEGSTQQCSLKTQP